MDLFDQHVQSNREIAKKAMHAVLAKTIGKYVIANRKLNEVLVKGAPSSKKDPCIVCVIDKLTRQMAELEAQSGQIIKAFELAFDNEEMEVAEITEAASKEFYPLTTSKKAKAKRDAVHPDVDFTSDRDEQMPEGVRDVISRIKSAIKGMPNSDVDMHVVDLGNGKSSIFGINPKDYKNFSAFASAVIKARKNHVMDTVLGREDHDGSDTTGEDMIKEAVIHTAEDNASKPASTGKRTKRTPKSPKLN